MNRDENSGEMPSCAPMLRNLSADHLSNPIYLVSPEVFMFGCQKCPPKNVLFMLLYGLINVLLHDQIIFKYIRSISVGKEIRNWWVIHVADFVSVGANIRNLVHTHILPPNLGPCQSLASYVRPFQSPSMDYAIIHPWESRPISCNCSWAASLSLYFSLAFDSTGNQSFIKFSNAQSTFAI